MHEGEMYRDPSYKINDPKVETERQNDLLLAESLYRRIGEKDNALVMLRRSGAGHSLGLEIRNKDLIKDYKHEEVAGVVDIVQKIARWLSVRSEWKAQNQDIMGPGNRLDLDQEFQALRDRQIDPFIELTEKLKFREAAVIGEDYEKKKTTSPVVRLGSADEKSVLVVDGSGDVRFVGNKSLEYPDQEAHAAKAR